MRNSVQGSKQFNLLSELSRFECPTLVIGGDADPIAPIGCINEIIDALPTHLVTSYLLEDCGHVFWNDQPQKGIEIVREFILNKVSLNTEQKY